MPPVTRSKTTALSAALPLQQLERNRVSSRGTALATGWENPFGESSSSIMSTTSTSASMIAEDGFTTHERGRRDPKKGPSDVYDTPPTYIIDLSLPPEQRYTALATIFRPQLEELTELFDEVVELTGLNIPIDTIKRIARLFLRRVHDSEQTAELRGISKATGVEMYLLVAFNVVLDLLMGCTSGGVKVFDRGKTKMLHFRTLDWEMEPLRNVVVQLEFVNKSGGEVIARSVTYVGFVGVLTGVRRNLSLSLNFRAQHNNATSMLSNLRYGANQLFVLLGLRPSIASKLRHYIIPPTRKRWRQSKPWIPPNFSTIISQTPSMKSTACYLILSNGNQTAVLEKDLIAATTHISSSFVVATNHDTSNETEAIGTKSQMLDEEGLLEFINESRDRKGCLVKEYAAAVRQFKVENPSVVDDDDVALDPSIVQRFMSTYPTLNECTHYAVIMDPVEGDITWFRRWKEPFQPSREDENKALLRES